MLAAVPVLFAIPHFQGRATKAGARRGAQDPSPKLGVSHIGFRPNSRKRVVIPSSGADIQQQVQITSGSSVVQTVLGNSTSYDFGAAAVLDFSALSTAGAYRAVWNGQQSPSFSINSNVWRNILSTLTKYQTAQRCGTAVSGVHAACHLDDSRRRDTGAILGAAGGWHDAGDLRKWVDSTLMDLFGILGIIRNLGQNWNAAGLAPLLTEAKWGNAFFLKMQDTDGLVWSDTAGGVNGDNSDNHWTDNVRGTSDDRFTNLSKLPNVQAMFITAQAMMNQVFASSDPAYAATCLNAAVLCWNGGSHSSANTTDLGWWTLAAIEMYKATGQSQYSDELIRLANQVKSLQFSGYTQNQSVVTGYFSMFSGGSQPLRDVIHPAMPAYALLKAAQALPSAPDAAAWKAAAQLYIDGYLVPMTSRSAYGIVPFGLYVSYSTGRPAGDTYRPLAGNLTYRFFLPASDPNNPSVGINSHLLSHALFLAEAAVYFGRSDYRDMAYAQLEWVFGNNPFGATLVTGLGAQNPPAFSPFVGPIAGGVMNGIAGSITDTPQLATLDSTYWETNEYWSPLNGYSQWAISVLELAA